MGGGGAIRLEIDRTCSPWNAAASSAATATKEEEEDDEEEEEEAPAVRVLPFNSVQSGQNENQIFVAEEFGLGAD